MLRDESSQNLRDYLIETAARLIDQRGSAGLAVRDIAREAKVADGVLYNYFEDKEDLLAHALLAHVGKVMASAPQLLPPPGDGHRRGEPAGVHRRRHREPATGHTGLRRADVPAEGAHPVPRDGRR